MPHRKRGKKRFQSIASARSSGAGRGNSGSSGVGLTVTVEREYVSFTSERQQITVARALTGGTFRIQNPVTGTWTSALNHNATTIQIRDALRATGAPWESCTVTIPIALTSSGGNILIDVGSYLKGNVAMLAADGSNLL